MIADWEQQDVMGSDLVSISVVLFKINSKEENLWRTHQSGTCCACALSQILIESRLLSREERSKNSQLGTFFFHHFNKNVSGLLQQNFSVFSCTRTVELGFVTSTNR